MDGVRLVRRATLGLTAGLALGMLGACNRDAGNAGANAGPYAKEVNEAVPRIEKAVGLPFKTPPKVERRSKDEVREFLTRKFNESMPAAEISGSMSQRVVSPSLQADTPRGCRLMASTVRSSLT